MMRTQRLCAARFSQDAGPQEDLNLKAGERLKAINAMESTCHVRNASLDVKRKLSERSVVQMI